MALKRRLPAASRAAPANHLLAALPADDYARARQTEAEFDRYLLERVAPERLLWGSDCPFVGHEGAVSYQDTLDAFQTAVPDPRTRRAISDAAHKFYFS